jgi:hypothetical protein
MGMWEVGLFVYIRLGRSWPGCVNVRDKTVFVSDCRSQSARRRVFITECLWRTLLDRGRLVGCTAADRSSCQWLELERAVGASRAYPISQIWASNCACIDRVSHAGSAGEVRHDRACSGLCFQSVQYSSSAHHHTSTLRASRSTLAAVTAQYVS